jgi:hypothetical protein
MCTFVYIPVSEHFSFAKIIHPPDRCGISRRSLNSMIITQVHLVLGTIKGHSKMCNVTTQNNITDVLRERAIGILTRGMSTRAVGRELHFINGNLNAQRYRDDILRPTVVPFILLHHLMFQHDNARPRIARICTQFLEAENVPVPA